jgi:broad specificity phosphatase PhoE
MPERHLYLLRHGQHHWGEVPEEELRGHLTLTGERQARIAAKRVAALPATMDVIHTSTLPRALETTAFVAARLPGVRIQRSGVLREVIPVKPTRFGKGYPKIPASHYRDARKRAESAVARLFKRTRGRDRHELVVSHGNLIRYLVCRALGAPPKLWGSMRINNASLSHVIVRKDGFITLASFNDVGHLPPNLIT